MRTIKYRAFDSKNKRMIYDDPYSSHPQNMTWTGIIYRDGKIMEWILQQFTGLIDTNKKEIYEGDILKIHPGQGCEWKNYFGIVKWDDIEAGFVCSRYHPIGFLIYNCKLEIIGNVFENKDLIPTVNENA